MTRYAIEVIYDGSCFHGSQLQGDTPTVQLAVNIALSTLLKFEVYTLGASRTDEGVHALCNVYHFDVPTPISFDLLYKFNAITPIGLSGVQLYETSPEFNARFDAITRQYRYKIYSKKNPFYHQKGLYFPYPLSVTSLESTAQILKEYTLFESFCKKNSQAKTYKCTIEDSQWEQVGDQLHYVVCANRFLRGMVRGLVATQLYISKTNQSPEVMRTIIDAQDCRQARFDVTGNGLYLERITYPEGALTPFKVP